MPRAKRKPPPAPEEILAVVREVPGVADAFVDDDSSPPGQLRVELKPGYGEAEVAAAVDAVLRQRFNLGVDEDELGVVEDAEMRAPGRAGASADDLYPRPSIDRMHVVSSGETVSAAITIGLAGRSAVGEATGPEHESAVLRTVGVATLRAAEELVDGRAAFELDHAEVIAVGGLPTAIVRVVVVRGDDRRLLTGAAVVRDDPRQAVIRAGLHAINRQLALLLTESR